MGEKNKRKLTLEEHINKLPYDIKKKIYKIVVEEAENIFDMARSWAGCCKSLRYDLWTYYMQKMPLGKFLSQIGDFLLYDHKHNLPCIIKELQESIGHRDDLTRWSYTHLSESDKQAIKNPLLSIIETDLHVAFIFNERNLHEYCKRLPCSRRGYFHWGAFKLDIIHMFLDYIVHYWRFHGIYFFTNIVERYPLFPKYLFSRSECDYGIPLMSNGTEIITGACLKRPRTAVSEDWLKVEYYELMPAPIDYKHLWSAFVEDEFSACGIERSEYYQKIFGTTPSKKPPIYRTCCRDPGYF